MQIQYLSSTKKLGQELPKGTPQKGFLQQWQMAKIEFGREKFYLLIELTTQFPILLDNLVYSKQFKYFFDYSPHNLDFFRG